MFRLQESNFALFVALSISSVFEDPVSTTSLGVFTVTVADGLSDPDLTFIFDGSTRYTTPIITGVPAGDHTIQVVDSKGCAASIDVFMPPKLTASVISVSGRCAAGVSGAAAIDVQGGRAPFVFKVDGKVTLWFGTVSGLDAGRREIVITDSSPTPQSVTLTVDVGTLPPVLKSSGFTFAADSSSSGLIWVNVTGAVPPYQYRLTPGLTSYGSVNFFSVPVGRWGVEARDANGCVESVLFTMNSILSAEVVVGGPTCPGGGITTATVNPSGGTSPYFIQIDDRAPTSNPSISNLVAGLHRAVITDSGTTPQTVTVSFNVEERDLILLNFDITPNTDPVNPDGSLLINATRRDPSVTFFFNVNGASQPDPFFSGLSDGVASVLVYDSDGCSVTSAATIPLRTLYVDTIVTPRCFGESTGSITLGYTVSTFTLPVNLTLVGRGQVNATVSDLVEGLYEFVLTDSAMPPSVSRLFVRLSQPDPVGASITTQMTRFPDYASGIGLWMRGVGGTGPYIHYARVLGYDRFEINTSSPIEMVRIGVSDLTWSITDSRGCRASGSQIGIPPVSLVTSGRIIPSCSSGASGLVSLVASGGIPPYTTQIAPLNGQSLSGNNLLTGANSYGDVTYAFLPSGQYLVSATDSTNRTATATITIGAITVDAVISPIPPSNDFSGQISVYPSDWGLAPFRAYLRGPTSMSLVGYPITFANLGTGSYEVELFSTSTGCVLRRPVSLVQRLSASFQYNTQVRPSCGLNNGKVSISVSGGVEPYSFIWEGESYSGATRDDVSPGSHTVIVRDSANPPNQIALAPLVLYAIEPPALTVVTRDTDISAQFGAITVYVTSNARSFTVFIDGAERSLGFNSGFRDGSHRVEVVDSSGCRVSTIANTRSRAVVAEIVGHTPAPCCGESASIELRSNPTWEYSRADLEIWQSSSIFSDLVPGASYTFTVRDKTDPGDIAIIGFISPAPFCFHISSVVSTIRYPDRTLVRVTVNLATSYFVSIDKSDPQLYSVMSSLFPVNTPRANTPITHNVTAWTREGRCASTVLFDLDPPLIVESEVSHPSCPGDNTGRVSLQILSGTPPFVIESGGEVTNETSFFGLDSGNHFYRVRDSGTPSMSVNVFTYVAFRPEWYVWDQDLAFRSGSTFSVAPQLGTGPFEFTLSNSTRNSTQTSATFVMQSSGVFNLTVMDAFSCRKSAQIRLHPERPFLISLSRS
jgi:hypothetical protein